MMVALPRSQFGRRILCHKPTIPMTFGKCRPLHEDTDEKSTGISRWCQVQHRSSATFLEGQHNQKPVEFVTLLMIFVMHFIVYLIHSSIFIINQRLIHCFHSFLRNSISDHTKTCITFDAINAAYLDARKRIRKYCIINRRKNKKIKWRATLAVIKNNFCFFFQTCHSQRATGRQKILPQWVNYYWTCPFSWRERKFIFWIIEWIDARINIVYGSGQFGWSFVLIVRWINLGDDWAWALEWSKF